MAPNTLAELAISVSERWGAPVFPVKFDKSPACKRGFHDASRDPANIRRLFSVPDAKLVGLATGRSSKIVVVDLDLGSDGQPDGRTWYRAHKERLPDTYAVSTRSGGRHYYFSSSDQISCSASKLAPKVDVRADGGYVVAAGPGYEVLKDLPLSPFPDWVKEQLEATKGVGNTIGSCLPFADPLEFRKEGRWYETVRGQVASLVARGVDKSVILDLSPHWTMEGYSHEETRHQVQIFVDSALAKGFARKASQKKLEIVEGLNFLDYSEGEVTGFQSPRYVLSNRDDLVSLPKLEWLIKNVMPAKGLAAVYGPSGSGKSFLLLDMAASICLGKPWFGVKTRKSDVLYLCLEGASGLQKRVLAWEKFHKRDYPSNFRYLCADFDLGNAQHVRDLIAVAPRNSCLIIDTLNRAAPGRDENSSNDMSTLLSAAKALGESLDSLILYCHHTGKDRSKGLRGHSSLHAAMDAEIEVTFDRKLETRQWSSSKLKDEKDGQVYGFRLLQHVLGYDKDGDPETSCTVVAESKIFQKKEPRGSSQLPAFKSIKSVIENSADKGMAGAPLYSKCVRAETAQGAVREGLGTVEANKRSNRARKIINDLISNGFLHSGIDDKTEEGWVWLP